MHPTQGKKPGYAVHSFDLTCFLICFRIGNMDYLGAFWRWFWGCVGKRMSFWNHSHIHLMHWHILNIDYLDIIKDRPSSGPKLQELHVIAVEKRLRHVTCSMSVVPDLLEIYICKFIFAGCFLNNWYFLKFHTFTTMCIDHTLPPLPLVPPSCLPLNFISSFYCC